MRPSLPCLEDEAQVLCDCLEAAEGARLVRAQVLEARLEAPPSSPVDGSMAALKPQVMLEAALEEIQAAEVQRPGA